jgi:hypothetical protein
VRAINAGENIMKLDLSLRNASLYEGCEIEEVAGRLNLLTPPAEAVNIVGRNIHNIIASIPASDRQEIILTGGMAVWSYLIVFHAVVHTCTTVKYNDGRSEIVISRHGR